ncbi:acyltransferase [Coniochaeta ligniaria NRRL 30616]|uniref:Acyltransferase n=1 Tax=Coniochaeta ligniaria NRRL 30616 TaxID=1408157 RepID=A0A1J7J6J6_9PEZI|nr:acyltransferase [Coniochaeta ligniaria NRRL 30616]
MDQHSISTSLLEGDESTGLLEEKVSLDTEGHGLIFMSPTQSKPRAYITAVSLLANRVRSTPWRSYMLKAAILLLPSFLQPRTFSIPARNCRLSPTAYLDGLRGLAALFVVFCHYSYTSFDIAEGWGYKNRNYNILRLPIIRLFYQGPAMVAIFFVVSGYALSLKPLKLMRSRSGDGSFGKTLGSSVFRRGMRLFIPTAASTLLVAVLIRVGLYEWTREFSGDRRYIRHPREQHYHRLATTGEQVRDWAWHMFYFVHVWGWEKFGGSTGLDQHLWTIPVEFRASMFLFLTMAGTSGLKTGARWATVAGLMCFTYRSDRWEMLLFFAGMLLAEWDLIRRAHEPTSSSLLLPHDTSLPRSQRKAKVVMWAWMALGILALFLLSQPDEGHEATPGWVFLSSAIPDWWSDKYRYWQCVGAVLLVLCVAHSPETWQPLFNTRPVQYLGKISYAIYLMHGPVLHTAGYAIQRWAWGITGVEGVAYNWGFALASVFVLPLIVWAADVFWRVVDAPVVRFARWFEGKCSVPT